MKLYEIKTEFDKYITIADPWIIDIVLGTLIGNALIQRDSIWMMVVAKSSGGKTTILRPADHVPNTFFLDDLTEKTFLSGYKAKGKETSLLKVIGDGVIAFSDFTTILSKNPVSRGEILGQMRVIADGNFKKVTGQGGGIPWTGKIGFLGASTPSIYFHLEQGKAMGERFTYYWMDQPTDAAIADKQEQVSISASAVQAIMGPMYKDYCMGVREWTEINGIPELKMTTQQRYKVKQASIFCVSAKATVHTNFKTGKVDQIPDKAGVGRDNKNFLAILHTMQLMDAYENDDKDFPLSDDRIKLMQKCAYSSVNRERRKIIEILVQNANGTPLTASQIGTRSNLNLEKDAVEMYLNPLHAIGLVKKQVAGNSFKWFIDDPETISFVHDVADLVEDTTPIEPDDTSSEALDEFMNDIKTPMSGELEF